MGQGAEQLGLRFGRDTLGKSPPLSRLQSASVWNGDTVTCLRFLVRLLKGSKVKAVCKPQSARLGKQVLLLPEQRPHG